MTINIDERLADDILFGARAIAQYIGTNDRRVYYLAEKKIIPVRKWGEALVSRKSELRAAASARAGA